MQGAFIPDLHTGIWRSDICIWRLFFTNYYLYWPLSKKMAPKTSLQGPLWPSSKIFWLKHCIPPYKSTAVTCNIFIAFTTAMPWPAVDVKYSLFKGVMPLPGTSLTSLISLAAMSPVKVDLLFITLSTVPHEMVRQ